MKLSGTESLICPRCGAGEVMNPEAPTSEWRFNIHAHRFCDSKGVWWSQCTVCDEAGQADKGWFKEV